MLKIEDNFNLSRRVAQSNALRAVNGYIAWSFDVNNCVLIFIVGHANVQYSYN